MVWALNVYTAVECVLLSTMANSVFRLLKSEGRSACGLRRSG